MDPVPPLGRIYQLAVQEESQRLASTEYLKTGDRVVLAAKAATEMHRSSGRNAHGRAGEEENPAFQMDRRDFMGAFRSDGSGHTRALMQMGGQDLIPGSDGPGRGARSNGQGFPTPRILNYSTSNAPTHRRQSPITITGLTPPNPSS